ncbi:MAG: phosphoribosyltransferase regulatory subunit [Acidobacteriota bacterium]|nr:phosphoribosyltransferase regulatory subunit [Acidobacteriota bacterium]
MRKRTENLTSSYPAGVRALLPDDVRRRRRVESAIVAALEARSFDEIVVPIIDFVDPYGGTADRESQRRSYRFVDRNGELIAVRSDFTPMVARALAPSLGRATLPLRVFYRGDVVRCEATKLGAQRELFQIGAELIGDVSPSADLAMLTLALELVTSAGVTPTVVLSSSALANQLIESSTGSRATRIALRSALAHKRSAAIVDFDDVSAERIALVRLIISGRATLDDLSALPETRDAANELASLQQRVAEETGANVVVAIDDIDEEPGYYTGMRFRIFDPRTRLRLAQGGRYDDLYARFGAPASAVGFTLTVDYLDGELR